MKKVQIIALFIAAFTCLSFTEEQERIIEMEKEINNSTPVETGIGYLTKVEYLNNDFRIYMKVNDNKVNISTLKQNRELVLDGAVQSFGAANNASKSLLETLADADASLSLVYESITNGDTIMFNIKSEDIKATIAQPKDISSIIDRQIKVTNAQLPRKVDHLTTLNRLYRDKKSLIFDYTVDEESVEFGAIKKNKKNIQENLFQMAKNGQPIYKMCKQANLSVKHIYTGSVSGQKLEIEVPTSIMKGE